MLLKAILLGIIEGLTEFLPISSTGHLIIANKFINFSGNFANTFTVVIQTGAILAVIIYFRDKLFPNVKSSINREKIFSLWSKVIVGFIPAAFLGLLLDEYIELRFFNPKTVALALIFGALLLIYSEGRLKRGKVFSIEDISYKKAFIVGIIQCLALWPGMSRSASTIIGGLFLGFTREIAAEFSFFLAIPTLLGATAVKLYKSGFSFTTYEWIVTFVGTFASFIVALVVIAFFMSYIKKRSFNLFAYYRILLGLLVLLLS
ncbi:MAG: UDP pyrophosphate phosphatase [Peptococcaceae bacterium BICA1-8]|nr:MAG: UDP pyrophosphate phosphatase [Peptococcaceae bacterium BICA1-8]